MVAYADTSFLVPIYVLQDDSARALAYVQRETESLPFTPFHRQEIRNAIRLCVFRKEITSPMCRQAIRDLEEDISEGILAHTPLQWTEALQKVEDLGAAYTESMGIRSLDLFHISCALQLKKKVFLTFDTRQRVLAKEVGLQVNF